MYHLIPIGGNAGQNHSRLHIKQTGRSPGWTGTPGGQEHRAPGADAGSCQQEAAGLCPGAASGSGLRSRNSFSRIDIPASLPHARRHSSGCQLGVFVGTKVIRHNPSA